MAVLTQIPKTNISVADIRDTLNANGGSVSNDTTTFFTTAAKINPWSKHKPVPWKVDFCQDFDSSDANTYKPNWWKEPSGQCGLTWTGSTNINSIKGGNWTYTPPGSDYPKRLGDFSEYVAQCNPPIATRISADLEANWNVDGPSETNNYKIYMDIPTGSDGGLTIRDFSALSDYYLYATVGNFAYKGDSIMAESPAITIDLDDLKEGSFDVFLCLVSAAGGYYVPLPSDSSNKTQFKLKVKRLVPYYIEGIGVSTSLRGTYTPLDQYPYGEGMAPTDSIYFKVKVIKNTSTATSLTDSTLTGYSYSWYLNEYNEQTEISKSLKGRLYNSSFTGVAQIPLSDMAVGEERIMYIYWDGYGIPANDAEYRNLDAGLSIYLNGAWVAGFSYYQTIQ